MSKIRESLYTLSHLATQISLYVETARATYKHSDLLDTFIDLPDWYADQAYSKVVLSMALNNIHVFANSYLDELQEELTHIKYPEYTKQILIFLKVVNPALKRIRKWTHLKEYRNQILVHNYRIKKVSIFSEKHSKKEYNAPTKDQEILLLAELIFLINKQLGTFFPEEVKELLRSKERIVDKYEAQENEIDFREEIKRITNEVEKLKNNL